MPSLPVFKKAFILSLLTTLSLAFLIFLGFWQLHRAEEKRQMLALAAKQALAAPKDWYPGAANPEQYARIRVEGHYLPDIFLLDNQHYRHHFGFHVFTPFVLDKEHYVFIDRGWIAGDQTRRQFPEIQTRLKAASLTGVSYYPNKKGWVLGPVLEKKQAKLTIIEQIDIKLLSQLLQKEITPFIIRLDQAEPQGFVREWPIVSMPPERHSAYAFQWFAMALVLFIIVLVLSFKKKS